MTTPTRRPVAARRPPGRGSAPRPAARPSTRVPGTAGPAGARSAWSVRRFMAVASVALLLAVLLGPTLKTYLSQRSDISSLRAKVAAQQADVGAMEHEKALWSDNAYVMQQARERLRFVKPGEKAFTVIDATPTMEEKLRERTSAVGINHPWYGQIWESAKIADNPQLASGG